MTSTEQNRKDKRRKALISVATAVGLSTLAWAAYQVFIASNYESTDNAYVQGNIIQITPHNTGLVQAILADDTDFVKAGQPLVQLDPADAKVNLAQAEANLAQTVRQVRSLYANTAALSAQLELREAEAQRAQQDLQRRQAAADAVSSEELAHAQAQLVQAQAAVTAAREQFASNQALTEGTRLEEHPSVQAAAARMREAWLADKRGALLAPADGVVAHRTVQVGQRVAPGTPLMSVVPLKQVWVDANFKEVQLRHIRIGQPVEVNADVYGHTVNYHGTVAGLGAGTGTAFALLPAQNATGNWIKVVQRVPVRIALDPKELNEHPLRVGLSMNVSVDVSHQDGPLLTESQRTEPVAQTQTYSPFAPEADAQVRRVIEANAGVQAKAH